MKKDIFLAYKFALDKQEHLLKNALKKYVQDKTVPLDHRWETFRSIKLGDSHPIRWSFEKAFNRFNIPHRLPNGQIKIQNNAYTFIRQQIDRGPKTITANIVVRLMSMIRENGGQMSPTITINNQDIIDAKEEILEKFIWDYKNNR